MTATAGKPINISPGDDFRQLFTSSDWVACAKIKQEMKALKIGIWMDHHQAHLTEFTAEKMTTTSLDAVDSSGHSLVSKGEKIQHHKEDNQKRHFFKQLEEVIARYHSVLLFGPTEAKTELFHHLKKDHRFEHIAIHVLAAERMTTAMEQAFIRNYFSQHTEIQHQ